MRNWFLGLVSGLILAALLFVLVLLAAVAISSAPPRVREATTVVLTLDGQVVEQNPTNLAARLLQRGLKPTLREVVENIDKAAADSRVSAMVVRPRGSGFGWAKGEELRAALLRFRKTGKKLYCHLAHSGLREYYLATACEKIYMQPVGFLDVKGIRAEALFWKGTLDKIGAQADLVQTGEYKTYSNTYTEKKFTPQHREMLNWLVDGLYGNVLKAISESRGKTVEAARAAVEAGPYEAPQAKAAGLVDELLYEDQVFELLKQQDPRKRLNKMSAGRYLQVPPESVGLRGRRKIGVVYAVGTIVPGEEGVDPLSGDRSMGAETVGRLLRQAADDSSVKAVVLRVDSPGGDALASGSIWRELGNLQRKKPVVISMSDVAASGGYYISAVGAPIVADPATITGSIGVVYGKISIRGLYDKVGLTKDMVTRGPNSLLDSDYIPYTAEQKRRIQALAEDVYQDFLRKVAAARKMRTQDMDAVARGRVFTGEQARQKGLVDELGGLDRAVELAKEKAGIPRQERVQLVPFPAPRTLLEILLERTQLATARLLPGPPQSISMPEPVSALLALRLFNSGHPLLLMPFRIEFR